MTIYQTLQNATTFLAWTGLILGILTIISFLFSWGARFRLVGATIFSFLLSASCWAFNESYKPPFVVEGAQYAPVVYDNGFDLVVAQASEDFPNESIQPTLEQIAGNLKGGGRNGAQVHIRLRKLISTEEGKSKPLILGEVIRDIDKSITVKIEAQGFNELSQAEEIISDDFINQIKNQDLDKPAQSDEFLGDNLMYESELLEE
tara:strand:- start:6174 stop:6785 length:612 start_codon:yes stop_codon:yes gene_type:complete